jgi:hypothetical protein
MPGRFPGKIPRIVERKWEVGLQREVQEFFAGLSDGMVNLQLTPGVPANVGASEDPGIGPAVALEDHTHRLNIVSNKGDILISDGDDPAAFPVGGDGQILSADSNAASGLNWQKWVWQTIRITASSIRVGAGGADTDTGNLIFRSGQDDIVFATFEMPHGFNPAVPVQPYIHWYKTTSAAGSVNWEMRWSIADIGDVFNDITAEPWTPLDVDVADDDTALLRATNNTPIDLSANLDSCIVIMALQRQSSAAGDDYAADVQLVEIDVHVQVASLGSTAISPV